ncbi:MAG: type I 3-dehydroquinate dehydratase, partial [Acidobacteria bacterium]|nr:type I 3-dehydroquinate dehydratase [Acidobacteriota bacterium]
MSARIVETVTGATTGELRLKRDAAQGRADIVELRVDGVDGLDLPALLADRAAPVIVTCRPVWEGGQYDGAEPERLRLLRRARALGAEFIDVEFRADWRSVLQHTEPGDSRTADGVVLSFHDHNGMPADLETIAAGMEAAGADVVKIAVTPHSLSDCGRLARIGNSLRTGAVIGMGPKGLVTRMAPERFNACWTYTGSLSQVGQIAPEAARDLFGIGRLGAGAALYGVVGNPVAHSHSPALHNAAFRHEGIDAVYAAFEAADFEDFQRFARDLDVAGASVTAPFKGDAFAAAATVDEAAAATEAANTLNRAPGGWAAGNTDAAGFLAPLEGEALNGMRAGVIGRGGASRSVAHALRRAGAEVTILGRDDLDRASEPWDLLVNATPVGTAPGVDASVMEGRAIRARLVYDLVYNPRETRLLRDARAAGARTIGGLDMLVAQACGQFEFWFG